MSKPYTSILKPAIWESPIVAVSEGEIEMYLSPPPGSDQGNLEEYCYRHYIVGVEFYTDDTGDTIADIDSGIQEFKVKTPVMPNMWQDFNGSRYDCTCGLQTSWGSPATHVKVEILSVEGPATHARMRVMGMSS